MQVVRVNTVSTVRAKVLTSEICRAQHQGLTASHQARCQSLHPLRKSNSTAQHVPADPPVRNRDQNTSKIPSISVLKGCLNSPPGLRRTPQLVQLCARAGTLGKRDAQKHEDHKTPLEKSVNVSELFGS